LQLVLGAAARETDGSHSSELSTTRLLRGLTHTLRRTVKEK
jgi:hypothetical protein